VNWRPLERRQLGSGLWRGAAFDAPRGGRRRRGKNPTSFRGVIAGCADTQMSEIEDKLARCDRHIADLTLRIAELKEASKGSGMLASATLITMLQRTLASWERHKASLIDTE
jgi:hypothetical protein